MDNERLVALRILNNIFSAKGYSNLSLDHSLRESSLDDRSKSLVTALVYGVVERKITLDYIISRYSKIRVANINPAVINILRMGLYQLIYMDKIPESAAVNEAVKLTRLTGQRSSSGFVNAILRSFLRNNKQYEMDNLDDISRLSVIYSLPEWLLRLWMDQYGREKALSLAKAGFNNPGIAVRVNILKTTPEELISYLETEGVAARKSDLIENALIFETKANPEKLSAFQNGLFHVQDIASQICCHMLDAHEGHTVYDFCSAPGGKSLTLAEIMGNKGKIKAFDLHLSRLKLIESSSERLGIDIIETGINDAAGFNDRLPPADRVLCDLPCSGLGVLAKKPDIRYKSFEEIIRLPELQTKILNNASASVKTGGLLVYSTCTLNKYENEDVIKAFLDKNSDFEVAENNLFGNNSPYGLTFFPDEGEYDGFFVSVLRRLG